MRRFGRLGLSWPLPAGLHLPLTGSDDVRQQDRRSARRGMRRHGRHRVSRAMRRRDGFFACLCQNGPARQRVIEHADLRPRRRLDGDRLTTARSVAGAGYVTDLWDCDGPGGPDTVCAVGPSCSLPPALTARMPTTRMPTRLLARSVNVCRQTRGGSTGPHCAIAFPQVCTTDLRLLPRPGDHCVDQPARSTHASGRWRHLRSASRIPSPRTSSARSTSQTGASALRQRQRWTTYLAVRPVPALSGLRRLLRRDPGANRPRRAQPLCTTTPTVRTRPTIASSLPCAASVRRPISPAVRARPSVAPPPSSAPPAPTVPIPAITAHRKARHPLQSRDHRSDDAHCQRALHRAGFHREGLPRRPQPRPTRARSPSTATAALATSNASALTVGGAAPSSRMPATLPACGGAFDAQPCVDDSE